MRIRLYLQASTLVGANIFLPCARSASSQSLLAALPGLGSLSRKLGLWLCLPWLVRAFVWFEATRGNSKSLLFFFLPWVLSVVGLAFSRASVAEHLPFSSAPNCRTGSYRNMASRSWKNFMVLVASPELWAYLTVLYSYLRFLYFARHCFQSLQTPNSCSLLAM